MKSKVLFEVKSLYLSIYQSVWTGMLKVCSSEPCTQGPLQLVVLDNDGVDTAGKQNEVEVDPYCSKL